jgi:cell wall-associated NlpC family hydrolase
LTGVRSALLILIAISAAACATTGGTPRPRPFPGAPRPPTGSKVPPAPTPPPPALPARDVVVTALMLKGAPYRNGGSDPSGFDCSGFVQWVFAHAQDGVRLPREVRDQYDAGRKIDLREVKPGDLLFFETVSRGASHVGLAIGGNQFVHAPSSRGVVRVERFTASYWSKRFVGARRVE